MKIELQDISGLTDDEVMAVKHVAKQGGFFRGIDHAYRETSAWFSGWFVYRGGSHVAIHKNADSPRIVLISEDNDRFYGNAEINNSRAASAFDAFRTAGGFE